MTNSPSNHTAGLSEKEYQEKKSSISVKVQEKMHSLSRSSTSSSSESFEMKNMRTSAESVRSRSPPRSSPKPSSSSTSSKTSKPKARAQSTTFSDCGRHSNQWLFGNVSITDSVKSHQRKRNNSGSSRMEEQRPSKSRITEPQPAEIQPTVVAGPKPTTTPNDDEDNIKPLSRETGRSLTESTTASGETTFTAASSSSGYTASTNTSYSTTPAAQRKVGPGERMRRIFGGVPKPSARR
ncbi:hypothetical protein M409DRAFT_50473 [Zasmidium cellare ATCC 36951]|uniref:Uncharacterized protein n=1 Tax=Zasmidium cellare ATCC 36951 TaxID=1080233 RepID=A0A6A6CYM5_ZASCE|nr:uncharacterized protein M409DRAFT_50473 [Zasmidium cellare ATCC 36951]KAF2171843.1 hypothetical protein M409DRAFT_50473 [Zasmidium cellare ATCC 36951]